ncbi:MAG TPA: amidohydrolase family protein [Candidatus Polarisedimenticolaceae bacterium]|nr:amidohydrolase family protein [Candidatus Polarisedimenticolaceae bacterium]
MRGTSLGRPGSLRRLGSSLACAVVFGAPSNAEPPEPPPFYAIRDVRVVSGAGETIERADVLLADGLIEAVGRDLEIPADAWVVDGDGLMLFPGLIDAMTDFGLPARADDDDEGGREPGDAAEIRGPEDRPRTTPWLAAADILKEDARTKKWREAGFTGAVTAPGEGLVAGQAAWINLGDESDAEQAVVATPVAMRLDFSTPRRSRSYPSSLMGVLSYIEQLLSDTAHYGAAHEAYRANPLGVERPPYDRALESLDAAIEAGIPFLMPGQLGREIDRAVRLAGDHGLPLVIYGGQGAYARVDALRDAGVPVLVSLNWPEAEKDRDPEADTPFRTHYHRRFAPTTPAALVHAGVRIAFYSDGLALPSEVFDRVRVAIDAGLGQHEALAALTSGPAGIYRVADRLGTIERGKIANLVLATDWPWAEGAEIKAVFVDGRKYEKHESDEPSEPPSADVSGTWAMTLTTPRGSREMTARLKMAADGKVTGELSGERGTTPVEQGRMSAELLRFKTTRTMGGRSITSLWSLTVEGEGLAGSATAGPMSMDVVGRRTAAGEPADDDRAAGEPAVSLEEFAVALALYQGPVARNDRFAITNATIWTVSGETIEHGTVVVEGGKIVAVGREASVGDGTRVIDGAGGHLIPGIVDAHSHIAIEGGVNEGSLAVTAMVAVGDVVNPDDVAIYRALAGGVTTANLLHGSANPIGGQNQVIKLRWGADAAGLAFDGAPPGIKFALGENPKRSNFRGARVAERYPQTRMGVMDVIRQAFNDAVQYRLEWEEYQRGERPLAPRRDLELEALVEILDGQRLVHSHCYRADEILQLIRLAEEYGFRIATLQHVLEGYKVADEIAEHGAGASTFSDWWGYKVEAYDAIPYNAALMSERGVLVSVNSDSGEEMRHLNQEAAKAVKWGGMDEIDALALVTRNPAIQLGIGDRVGSIEVGKDADLVLYDGHPLSMRSVVQKTFVDGDLYFDREHDRQRQAAIDAIEAELAPAAKDDEGKAPPDEAVSKPSPAVAWQDGGYSCREER